MSANVGLAERIKRDYLPVGKCRVGEKLPTIKELALRYQISCPTVGKAIEALSKQGWVYRKQGSGVYAAKLCGGQEAADSTQYLKIGYIAHSMRLPLPHRVLEGVEYMARRRDYALIVGNSNGQIVEEKRQIERMLQQGAKGVVLYPVLRTPQCSEYLTKEFQGFPIVVVDLYEKSMNRPHVVFDNYSAGRAIVRHLLGQGRTHIAFLNYPSPYYQSVEDRAMGYRRALEDAGAPELIVKFADDSWPIRSEIIPLSIAIQQLISKKPAPDAIILPSEVHVPEAIDCLRKAGLVVPDDIMVASFDNLGYTQYGIQWPTTDPDFMRMGEYAVEKLLESIASNSNSEASEVILPCPVVMTDPRRHFEDLIGAMPHACRTRSVVSIDPVDSACEHRLQTAL